jgi:hypothetical protein
LRDTLHCKEGKTIAYGLYGLYGIWIAKPLFEHVEPCYKVL